MGVVNNTSVGSWPQSGLLTVTIQYRRHLVSSQYSPQRPKIMFSHCRVCHHKEDPSQLCKHYGASSPTCSSCRAFFRRVQQRKTALKCKRNEFCKVDRALGTFCGECRYKACLSVGMQPHLVLNEEQKKQRFKASILVNSKFATENDEGVGQEAAPIGQDDTKHGEAEPVTAIRVSVIQNVKRSHQER